MKKPLTQAELLLPTTDLTKEMAFFQSIGFRLEQIFPADDPAVAVMSGHGLQIRLDRNATIPPPTIRLLTDQPATIANGKNTLIAPNGTRLELHPLSYHLYTPKTQHKFETRQLRDNEPWIIGRAGMMYRDLIPDRLGGSIIASHIRIPTGGPVPDMVHYHTIGFQLIYCYRGWVRLVYEDQGPPFILNAGDCVTQPPQIRHRVLESSDNLEVIEIGVPSEHLTTIDHDMELPTPSFNPTRVFGGQRFCHHQLKKAVWQPSSLVGFETRDTGILQATNGMASVQVIRPRPNTTQSNWTTHTHDVQFMFVTEGQLDLETEQAGIHSLKSGAAFVIPPGMKSRMLHCTQDLELLEVAMA